MSDKDELEDLRKRVAELERWVGHLRPMVAFLVKEHWKAIGYKRSDSEERELDKMEEYLRALEDPKGTA
jgi:hypothetical protein